MGAVVFVVLAGGAGTAAAAAPPPLPVPALPSPPVGGGWSGVVTEVDVSHSDQRDFSKPFVYTNRRSAVLVTTGDTTLFRPESAPGSLVSRSPMRAVVSWDSSFEYLGTCEGNEGAGTSTDEAADLFTDVMQLDESTGVLTTSLRASARVTTTQTHRTLGARTSGPCDQMQADSDLRVAAGLPLGGYLLGPDGSFAASGYNSFGNWQESEGTFVSRDGSDIFTGSFTVFWQPGPPDYNDFNRTEWRLTCPTGVCVRRVRSDAPTTTQETTEPTPVDAVPAGANTITRLIGAGRSRGAGDVAIQCGVARFDWYDATGRPSAVGRGDRVCVHVVSNDLSRALWAAARAGRGTLTKVYRDEIATAATSAAVETAARTGALAGIRLVFARIVPQAATTLGRANLIFAAGSAIGWGGVGAGYLTALSKVTAGRSCFAFISITRGGRTTIADVRFLFGVSDLKHPVRDAELAVFAPRDRVERRLRPDEYRARPIGVSCGRRGSALAGPFWETDAVLSDHRRWVAGRADL